MAVAAGGISVNALDGPRDRGDRRGRQERDELASAKDATARAAGELQQSRRRRPLRSRREPQAPSKSQVKEHERVEGWCACLRSLAYVSFARGLGEGRQADEEPGADPFALRAETRLTRRRRLPSPPSRKRLLVAAFPSRLLLPDAIQLDAVLACGGRQGLTAVTIRPRPSSKVGLETRSSHAWASSLLSSLTTSIGEPALPVSLLGARGEGRELPVDRP